MSRPAVKDYCDGSCMSADHDQHPTRPPRPIRDWMLWRWQLAQYWWSGLLWKVFCHCDLEKYPYHRRLKRDGRPCGYLDIILPLREKRRRIWDWMRHK